MWNWKLYAEYGLTPLLVFVQNVAYCCLHLFYTRNAILPVAKGCLLPTQETCGGFLEGSGWSNLEGYHFNFAKAHLFSSHNGIIWRWYLFLWKFLLDCFCILFLRDLIYVMIVLKVRRLLGKLWVYLLTVKKWDITTC